MTPEPSTTLAPPARHTTGLEVLAERPVFAAVLGALTIAFSGILVKLADVPPATAAVFRCAYALPFLLLLARAERRAYGPRAASQVRWAWIAGIFFAIDLELYHHTIGLVGAGLATVLGNTQVVFVALLAWLLLRERLPLRTALAIPLVLAGVTLISGVIGSGAYGQNPQLGVVIGLAHRHQLRGLPADPAPWQCRPAPTGRTAVRRHPVGHAGLAGDRLAAGRAGSRPDLAGPRLPAGAGALFPGGRLAR